MQNCDLVRIMIVSMRYFLFILLGVPKLCILHYLLVTFTFEETLTFFNFQCVVYVNACQRYVCLNPSVILSYQVLSLWNFSGFGKLLINTSFKFFFCIEFHFKGFSRMKMVKFFISFYRGIEVDDSLNLA